MNRKKLFITFGIVAILLAEGIFFFNLHKKSQATDPGDHASALSVIHEEVLEPEPYEDMIPDMQTIVKALEKTATQADFSVDTDSRITLNGRLIRGDFQFQSHVSVTGNGTDHLHVRISSASSLQKDTIKGEYKNGVYTETNGAETTKTRMSEEEVMLMTSSITDLVKSAATEVNSVSIKERDDKSLVYIYDVPASITRTYINDLVKELSIEDLNGASTEIETTTFTTVLDADGNLIEQSITVEGAVKKSIIKVPATATIQAIFPNK